MNLHTGSQTLVVPIESFVNIYAHGHCADFQTREEAALANEPAVRDGGGRVAVAHYRLVGIEVTA